MQLLNVGIYPIYLPFDKAQVPFGDPIEGVTCTSATPGVVTAPGAYVPVVNDLVSFTFLAGGSIPTGIPYATPVYVQSATQTAGLWTFTVSLTKGGGAIATSSTGSLLVLHLLSGETDGVNLPFKPNNTVLVENNTGGSLTLQGSPDTNLTSYGAPSGPSGFVTLVVVPANSRALVSLTFDWIRVSTNATLSLVQN